MTPNTPLQPASAVDQHGLECVGSDARGRAATTTRGTSRPTGPSPDLVTLVHRLCHASTRRSAPPIEWPQQLAREQWFVSPELLSLAGTPEHAAMSQPQRQRLSFLEAVSFFSLNLHGERFLVRGLIERAARPAWRSIAPYLEHFRAEEQDHMAMFGEFCRRYAGKLYADRTIVAARAAGEGGRDCPPLADGEEDVLFFARALIFEEIADAHNRLFAADPRLAPLARLINRQHHRDETRHLAFGRALVRALFAAHAPAWPAGALTRVRRALAGFVSATWRAYYNPDVYRDIGCTGALGLRDRALATPQARARQAAVTPRALRVLRVLRDCGLLLSQGGPR